MTNNPKSYTCACGAVNQFAIYVFAHWNDLLIHTCDCGRKNEIVRGVASISKAPKAKKIEASK